MIQSFWHELTSPILGLSPMDGVSDQPFRHIQKKYGQPAVVFTEFTSVEGLCHGAQRLLKDFLFDETQRPIIGQIYGTTPEYFRQAAIVLATLGFDGVDINMGCPAKNVSHSGAGAALIENPTLAQTIVRAVKQGLQDWQNGATVADCPDLTPPIRTAVLNRAKLLPPRYQVPRPIPVSIKTRIGYHQPVIADWIPRLIEVEPELITIHGRTLKQHYGGVANWDAIGQAAELAHSAGVKVLGNGDIQSRADAEHRVATYGLDGALIGRSAMGNPFVFRSADKLAATPHPSRFDIALEHSQLFEATYQSDEFYNFLPMRKHLGWYVREVPGASQIRIELFQASSSPEVAAILQKHQLI